MVQHADIDHTGLPGIPGGAGAAETIIVFKSADEIVNGSATLQDDNDLLHAIGANEEWAFELHLFWTSGTTPDFKYAFTCPAGATLHWARHGVDSGSSVVAGGPVQSGTGTSAADTGTAGVRHTTIHGIILNGATPGNLQLQWAQNTSNASDTTLHAGSNMKLWELV